MISDGQDVIKLLCSEFRVLNTIFQHKARNTYFRQSMEILPIGSEFTPSCSLALQEMWLRSPVLVNTTFSSLALNHCLGNATSHGPQSPGQPFSISPCLLFIGQQGTEAHDPAHPSFVLSKLFCAKRKTRILKQAVGWPGTVHCKINHSRAAGHEHFQWTRESDQNRTGLG